MSRKRTDIALQINHSMESNSIRSERQSSRIRAILLFVLTCLFSIAGQSQTEPSNVSERIVPILYYLLDESVGSASPMVSFDVPNENQEFLLGDPVVVSASASDSDGSIVKVDLYVDDVIISSDIQAPYQWSGGQLNSLSVGTHVLTVEATDNLGNKASVSRSITVNEPNEAPTVSFLLPTQTIFESGQSIIVEAAADDVDGDVAGVQLFVDDVLIREEGAKPYTWNDTSRGPADAVLDSLSVGQHTLRLVATDNEGAQTASELIITVEDPTQQQAPTVSFLLPTQTVFEQGQSIIVEASAADADGNVAGVQLFIDDVLVRQEVSPPYTWNDTSRGAADAVLDSLSVGQHTLRLVATDNEGLQTAVERTITVESVVNNQPPTVNFTTPNNNQTFTENSAVNVAVNASDDSAVVRVDLYVDGAFDSSDNSAPYSWSLSNLALGGHTLRAIATDDQGLESESTISITIDESVNPPVGDLSKGRAVKNVLARRTLGVTPDEQNHNNFASWSVVSETNASINVAGDGRSVTFSRNVFNNGVDARAYIEFTIGEVWSDDDLSVCFQVQGYAEDVSGNRAGALEVVSNDLSGTKTRTVTQNGIYCTVLTVDSTIDSAVVRLGLGVTGNDTRTNELTISRFSVSPTADGLPNEFVLIDQRGQTPSQAGISGAAFNYDKQVNYDPNSGLTSFTVPASVNTGPSASHVLAITDSFGGFFFGGVWYPFYGLDSTNTTPNYVMTMNNQAGRSLADTNPDNDTLLDTMLAEAIAKNANDGAPGVCWLAQGVNDFVVESNTASETRDNLQAHIDWCQDNGMFPVLVTAGPFNGFQNVWTPTLEAARTSYNSQVRSLVSNSSGQIALVDYDLLLDADRNGILDSALSLDGLHPNADGMAVLSEEADSVFNQIIDAVGDSNTAVNAVINPSRTECASPCTVVFSADKTTAQGLDDHSIWTRLSYHWDFNTDESDVYGHLYDQAYTYVDGDTAFEAGHVPMATKTFLCETGTCTYNVGMRAQNEAGEFDDAFVTITVNAESMQWNVADTICVSNTLSTSADWTGFDKPCPAGATKQATFPLPDQLDGKLVLLRRGDVFDSDDMRYIFRENNGVQYFWNRWYIQTGQSNFKVGNFGAETSPFPHLKGTISTVGSYTQGETVSQADITSIRSFVTNADVVDKGWSKNGYFEGLKMVGFIFPESFEHIGLHDIDMDAEDSEFHDGGVSFPGGVYCTDHPTVLDCANVPFPKGGYISKVNVVGTPLAEINRDSALNVAGIGCSMVNFTGIVDSQFRKVGEHNVRIMGWWRLNIMRSFFRGEHYLGGKQRITLRPCAQGEIYPTTWQTLTDLPAGWRSDPEGKTRADTFLNNGSDQYIHLSRYHVSNGNRIGDADVLGAFPSASPVQIKTLNGDESLLDNVVVSQNVFEHDQGVTSSINVSIGAIHSMCVDNLYANLSRTNGCFPSWLENFEGSLREPTPITPPLKPGS